MIFSRYIHAILHRSSLFLGKSIPILSLSHLFFRCIRATAPATAKRAIRQPRGQALLQLLPCRTEELSHDGNGQNRATTFPNSFVLRSYRAHYNGFRVADTRRRTKLRLKRQAVRPLPPPSSLSPPRFTSPVGRAVQCSKSWWSSGGEQSSSPAARRL